MSPKIVSLRIFAKVTTRSSYKSDVKPDNNYIKSRKICQNKSKYIQVLVGLLGLNN
jgi:hypothetical protein